MPRKSAISQMNLKLDSLATRVFSNLKDSMIQQHDGKKVLEMSSDEKELVSNFT